MSSPTDYQHHHSPVFSPSPIASSSSLSHLDIAGPATTIADVPAAAAALTSPHLTALSLGLAADSSNNHNNNSFGRSEKQHHQAIPRSHAILPSSSPTLSTSPHPRGIRKKASSRHRSASYVDRLRHISLDSFVTAAAADSAIYCEQPLEEPTSNTLQQWFTPQHSPQTSSLLFPDSEVSLVDSASSSYQSWSVPTPPHSDSGIPPVAADDQASIACGSVSTAADFAFDDVVASVEMSSLGYLLPGQYTNGIPRTDTDQYNMDAHHRSQSVNTSSSPYSHAASSSPSLYQGRVAPQYSDTRHSGSASSSVYAPNHGGRRLVEPYDSPATSDYSGPSTHTIPPLSGLSSSLPSATIGSPDLAGMPQHYASHVPRHSGVYDPSSYYTRSYTTAPSQAPLYAPQHNTAGYPTMPYNSNDQMSRASSSDMSARGQTQRPKAQCWEHGCNGRQFSTFSNLLRHQREKSGTATKSYCPKCGAEFTRTTARNGHLLHDKCTKTRRASEER